MASLRRARPDISIEIRWCPAHKGVPGNEKADEWAKLAAEEPDTNGVEWLAYSARVGARAMPLPRSLARLKREITEKKWAEARKWAGSRTSRQKYRMPKSLRPALGYKQCVNHALKMRNSTLNAAHLNYRYGRNL